MKKERRKRTAGIEDARLSAESGDIAAEVSLSERLRDTFSGTKIMSWLRTLHTLVKRRKIFLLRTVLPAVYCLLFGGTGLDLGIYPFGISAIYAVADGKSAFIAAAGCRHTAAGGKLRFQRISSAGCRRQRPRSVCPPHLSILIILLLF